MKSLIIIVLCVIIVILLIFLIKKERNGQSVAKYTPKKVTYETSKEYNLCQSCKDKGIKIEKGLNAMANDGGSLLCNGCNRKYHMCKGGHEKYGSPGPLLCKFCNPKTH